ncbi:hypothetical protein OHA21_37580 [Actinoplanes sp. NBC_00393]|uniref:hypothetical protein n=1 Tax=Actinoplanes sp. NBC_00393 TaxID=2975953 RepID=UPI002E1B248D
MRNSRVALAAAVLTGFSALAFAVSSGTASAETQAALPISYFGDIVVDGVHDRVFISDPQGGKIIATDFTGKVLVEKSGLPWVNGLALSSDSTRLYAAVSRGHAIVALATDTVAETARYPVGTEVYPESVTAAGDKVWFGYSGPEDDGDFGSVDLADSSVYLNTALYQGDLPSAPHVYTSAAAPGVLLVADSAGKDLWKYDVSSGSPVLGPHIDPAGGFAVAESAFTADGSDVVRAANGDVHRVGVSDLATTGTYPALARANGVDVNAAGRVAISVANQATGDDVYVFEGDSTTASQTIRLPEKGGEAAPGSGAPATDGIQDRGIAWEPGGPRLFGVAKYDGAYRLWVMNGPATPATPQLTLNGNGSVHAYGKVVTFTAHLGATGTNRTVEIWADPYGPEKNRLVKKGVVNSAGNLSASFKLTRNTTLTAKFAGDAKYAARTVTSRVSTQVAVSTAISKHYKTARIGSTKYFFFRKAKTPVFTTTITAYAGRKQKLVVETWSNGKWRPRSATFVAVKANGLSAAKLTGAHPLNVRFRVRSVYIKGTSGDSANATTYGAWKYFTFRK